jgi:hypothetical protein
MQHIAVTDSIKALHGVAMEAKNLRTEHCV